MNINIWKKLLVFYVFCLIIFIIFKFDGNVQHIFQRRQAMIENMGIGGKNYSLTPFANMMYYFTNITEPFAFKNIFANTLPYTILAFWLKAVSSKNQTSELFLYCISFCIITRLLSFSLNLGYFDIDDIILNACALLIGFWLFHAVFAGYRNIKK